MTGSSLHTGRYRQPQIVAIDTTDWRGPWRYENGALDFSARYYYRNLGIFTTPDPCQEDYPRTMPMLYCLANPANLTDPSGCSTNVVQNPDGAYKVIGGDLSDRYGHNWGLNRIKQHMRNSVPNVFPYSLYRR